MVAVIDEDLLREIYSSRMINIINDSWFFVVVLYTRYINYTVYTE